MKTVLILGAGVYQLPLIHTARAMGCRVCVASYRGTDPGMALADEPWVVDTTNVQGIAARAAQTHLDAVVTTGTDVAVPAIGYLCDHLGLPGINAETARLSSSKSAMQQCFAAHGVPTAAFRCVRSLREAQDAAAAFGYPVVVKTPESSGSRGITVVEAPDVLPQAVMCAMQLARHGEILVEQYLSGIEFGAQIIVSNSHVVHCLCHNDLVTPPPVAVPIGHSCPALLPASVQDEARAVCEAAVRAIGIVHGVCNADLIHTADGVRVFEIAARAGATGLPEIIKLHFGLDLYAVALQQALGAAPDTQITIGQAAAIVVIRAPRTGRLERQRIPDDVLAWPGVQRVSFDYSAGTLVRAFRTGPDRIGDVLVTASSAAEAERLAQRVVAALEIDVSDAGR
jgi:biotin carboxylase